LLIVKLTRPSEFIPESSVLAQTLAERDYIWSDLLDTLNRIISALRDVPEAPPLNFRMADFASFGWRLSYAGGGKDAAAEFCRSLEKLQAEQDQYAVEEDPVTSGLGIWLSRNENIGREVETGELFKDLCDIARNEGLILPKSSSALGKRLRSLKRAIEGSLGIKISYQGNTKTSHWVFQMPSSEMNETLCQNIPSSPSSPSDERPF